MLNKLVLSCAKLRPAYTSYPLVFGKLAYAEAVYYAQLCLFKLSAAEKYSSGWGWVIKSTNKISWAELSSTQVALVVS